MFCFAPARLSTAESSMLAVNRGSCDAKRVRVPDFQPTPVRADAAEVMAGSGAADEDIAVTRFRVAASISDSG